MTVKKSKITKIPSQDYKTLWEDAKAKIRRMGMWGGMNQKKNNDLEKEKILFFKLFLNIFNDINKIKNMLCAKCKPKLKEHITNIKFKTNKIIQNNKMEGETNG